jgi:HAD superfamily hydrolase (TIGR01458 family)
MDVKGVLLDLSGVLYVGDEPVPGASKALDRLRDSGLPIRYLTNTTRRTRAAVHASLASMGFEIDEGDIFTAPSAVRAHLRTAGLRPWLLIHPALEPEFADVETQDPNAVVIGDAGDGFTYHALNEAFRLLMDGAPLLAMGDNRFFREADGLSLDIGPFVKALEFAAGVDALVLGKPAAGMFLGAVEELGCSPEEAIMVGDDVASDVEGAVAAGMQALLVRTGKFQAGDDERIAEIETAGVVDDLAAAVERILGSIERVP